MKAVTNYINEALTELHQVRWPTKQQAIRLSAITLGFTLAASVVFGAMDFVLSKITSFMLSFIA